MTEEKFSIKKYAAVIAILMVLVMTVLDVTVVNVALPVLSTELGVSDSLAVWIVTVYQLAITMLLLPLSSVGDLYSYRRNFLIGVGVFTIASVCCAASQSFAMIIASRATPVARTGGAGGMQSTARLVGQTLGATAVTLIFAVSDASISVYVCLYIALGMAAAAGILSLTRARKL